MNIIYNNFVFPNTNKKPLIFIDIWISTFLFKYLNNILYFKQSILFYIYTPFLYFFVIFMRFNFIIQLNILMDIITVDRLNNFPNRFELIYCFWNINLIKSLKLQITANIYNAIFSISSLFPSAAWLERESWDMYGVKFLLHKNLRRILTDYGFKGHPQRKDFPLSGFVEIRFDDLYQSVVIEPIELMQSFRFFSFSNSWNNWYKLNFYG